MGRVIQFSDVHFGCDMCTPWLAHYLDYAHAAPHDLVLITGDITQRGLPAEFAAAGEWIAPCLSRSSSPWATATLPYWDVMARLFWPWRAFEAATGHPAHDHEFRYGDLMVRRVTTARSWQARANWSKGVIDLGQARRAAEALRHAPVGALRILACHHPLIEMIGAPMTGEVKRGDKAALIFAEAGVDLITTGHVHVPLCPPCGIGGHRPVGPLLLRHRLPEPCRTASAGAAQLQPHRVGRGRDRGHGGGLDRPAVRGSFQTWRLPRRQDTPP